MCDAIVTTFVNDLNIFALRKSKIISQIKSELAPAFNMTDMRPFAFYVRLKVTQDWKKKTIKFSQPGYIKKLLDCYSILKAKTTKIFLQEIILFLSDAPISDLKKAKYLAKIEFII